MKSKKVCLEFMKPQEILETMGDCPTIFLPIGTIEWHGLHNPVGLDSLKAHRLCELAAIAGGGLVHPAHYGAIGGLNEPHTFVFDPENDLLSVYFNTWIEKWCAEAHRNGFKAIILLTGHYGPSQQINVRSTAVKMSKLLHIPVLGTPEYFLALDKQYYGDHAAYFETSLMMDLYPDTVDLSFLSQEPYQGVYGKDPKQSSASDGAMFNEPIIQRLGVLSRKMPTWDHGKIQQFILAEQALVNKQLELATKENSFWGGWRNISAGVFDQYAQLLIEERFDEIVSLVERL